MRYLLDTHVFLWLVVQPEKLSETVIASLENSETQVFMSSISVWEIEQKCYYGKMNLPDVPSMLIEKFRRDFSLLPLPFDDNAAFQLQKLPDIHHDPFDRMLICQAIQHSLPIVTNDRFIVQYPIKVVW